MKGLICYFSGSGNTKAACQKIAWECRGIDFDLFNVVTDGLPALEKYEIIGLASFADFGGPSQLMKDFIGRLRPTGQKAFVFNTYGMFSGKTLYLLQEWAEKQGFKVVNSFSLPAPESFPPLIVGGMANENNPGKKELQAFNDFIRDLPAAIAKPRRVSWLYKLMPIFRRTKAKLDMGIKQVDAALCTKCGLCARLCPYHAIEMKGLPVFDQEKCFGCWVCFNHCPTKAISTRKIKGKGQYPKPAPVFLEKMK